MSASMNCIPEAGFAPILHLPHELLFEIISLIPETSDLLSLALSCRGLSSQVIPHHIDYRILHIRTLHPILFAHLARRTDLARNIHEVHISEKHNYGRGDRIPSRLVDMATDGNSLLNGSGVQGPEGQRIIALNVCKALRCMSNLRSFTWEWNGVYYHQTQSHGTQRRQVVKPTSESRFEDAILGEVARQPTLEHFGLSGPFGMHVDGASVDNKFEYPVWHLSNLTSLELSGDTWLKASNILPLCIMLSRSPNLECLAIPLEFKHLPVLRFPKLRKAQLQLHAGATNNIDASATAFIENHPSLEELSWYPIGIPRLRKGVLPNLKRLKSTVGVITALVEADARPEEDEQMEASPVPVVQSQPTPPPAAMLTVPGAKAPKRLSMIQEAEEPEESTDDMEVDPEATPMPRPPLPLSEDDDAQPPSPSDATAQYLTYSEASSSTSILITPTITLNAPPSTPTSILSGQQAASRRQITSLDILSLSASTLLSSAPLCMDPAALQEVTVHTFGDIQDIISLADAFPNIRWLSLPAIHLPPSSPHPVPWTNEALLSVLPRFRQLEVLRGGALWRAAGSTSEEGKRKVHETLGLLVQLCPKLREVDHCDWFEKRAGYKRVVVSRDLVCAPKDVGMDGDIEMEEVEAISYSVRKPVVRSFFDVLVGSFS
ncbi:hypothetical protein DFP72DRAFT_967323 [Ephemerocybe angulata]|uniref:F-box domain-containing protein n=1 Tax=Ephemerocybe angulata TaxID=980116 RepID=A0A8H6M6H2_9AGAR|nr:hypothetical protein DFP72DRAFT_967323 [Tulosesus angulatus]